MQLDLALDIPPLGEGGDVYVEPPPDFTATVISLGYGVTPDTRTVISMGFVTS